jgi:hypothetical protein
MFGWSRTAGAVTVQPLHSALDRVVVAPGLLGTVAGRLRAVVALVPGDERPHLRIALAEGADGAAELRDLRQVPAQLRRVAVAEADERLDPCAAGLGDPVVHVGALARVLVQGDVPRHDQARVLDPEPLEARVVEHVRLLVADAHDRARGGARRACGDGAEDHEGDGES